jgi:hypothetical protein
MKRKNTAYIVGIIVVLLIGCFVIEEAAAIIGRPLTPVSCAGVARRTTRRVVAVDATATTAAMASASATEAAAASAQAPPQAPAPAAPPGAPPIGTTASSLPSGCVETTVNDTAYQNCGGVYYRSAFQGNNLVYVVVQKP